MTIIPRTAWRPKHGVGHPTGGAKLEFFLHHVGKMKRLAAKSSQEEEMTETRRIEAYHASGLTEANPRIAYTFLAAQSGRVYEGTGWDRIGAHTLNHNSSSYAVCLLVNGDVDEPTPQVVQAVAELRAEGVRQGKLHPNHAFRGHRDAKSTECPGELVYRIMIAQQMKEPPAVREEAAVAVMPSLRRGSGGTMSPRAAVEAVKELQKRLGLPSNLWTGFFGEKTERAVRAFQRQHDLKPDGIVGIKTWRALEVDRIKRQG